MIFAYAGTARDEVVLFTLSKEVVSSNKNAENKLCKTAAEVCEKSPVSSIYLHAFGSEIIFRFYGAAQA